MSIYLIPDGVVLLKYKNTHEVKYSEVRSFLKLKN
jgi:hypothetical protein